MVFDIFQVGLVSAFSFQFSRFVCLETWDLNRTSTNETTNHHCNGFCFFCFVAKFALLLFFFAMNEDESFNFVCFKNQVDSMQFWGWVKRKCVMHITQFTKHQNVLGLVFFLDAMESTQSTFHWSGKRTKWKWKPTS